MLDPCHHSPSPHQSSCPLCQAPGKVPQLGVPVQHLDLPGWQSMAFGPATATAVGHIFCCTYYASIQYHTVFILMFDLPRGRSKLDPWVWHCSSSKLASIGVVLSPAPTCSSAGSAWSLSASEFLSYATKMDWKKIVAQDMVWNKVC